PSFSLEVIQHLCQNDFGAKVFLGNFPCSTAVPSVVRLNGVESGNYVLDRTEGKQALAGRKDVAEPRFLGNHGFTGGQIRRASFTEPARVPPYIVNLR